MRLTQACVLLAVLLVAVPAAAQCPDKTAATGTITGSVVNRDGSTAKRRVVQAFDDKGNQIAVVIADTTSGTYRIDGLCAGDYMVGELGGTSYVRVTAGGTPVTRNVVASRPSSKPSPNVASKMTLTILLFALGLVLFRHHNIVRTNRELLCAQVDNLATRIRLETDRQAKADVEKLATRAEEVKWNFTGEPRNADSERTATAGAKQYFLRGNVAEWLFWTRGRELAGWMRLHELERQVVSFLVPEERVVERAVSVEADLRRLNTSASIALADRLRQTLQDIVSAGATHSDQGFAHRIEHLKQQLAEGLTLVYDNTDTKFAELMEWHNKAMFLVYLALLGIATLGFAFHHEELFLLGAVGGLMSRMTRSLFRESVPNDYGASWTTLFLSPLLGAISAWIGIALVVWLQEVDVLGATIGSFTWDRPVDAGMIALAFTLGFSERLFTSLLSKVEGRFTDELNAPTKPASPAPLTVSGTLGSTVGSRDGAATISKVDRIVLELDLKSGERAAFIGPADSASRAAMVRVVGAERVVDVSADAIGAQGPFDAVLFETPPTVASLTVAAAQLSEAMQPDGRVVIVGSTPAALFEGDAGAQRAQGNAGPALVKEILVGAGLSGQDPPEKISGGDPTEWIASFVKPVPGGNDR